VNVTSRGAVCGVSADVSASMRSVYGFRLTTID
jgi:hypothetical protein